MAATPSRRFGWAGPSGGDPADVPRYIVALRDAIDAVALGYGQGPLASRPAFGTEGRQYYATDDGAIYYDTGTGWVPYAWQPGDVRWSAAGTRPPTGWAACDGSPLSRTRYLALFTAIGVVFGEGDRSTTFNVPDARGVVLVGAGFNRFVATADRRLGEIGGEETHRLTTAEMPAHTHQVVGGGAYNFTAGGGIDRAVAAVSTTNTGSTGGDGAHNNMPPYLVLNAWIKT